MKRTYHIDKPIDEVVIQLKRLIEKPGENTLRGHYRYNHGRNSRVHLMGEVKGLIVVFWATLHPGNLSSGIYPVVKFSLSGSDRTTIQCSSQWSPLGKVKLLILYGSVAIFLLVAFVFKPDSSLTMMLNHLIAVILLIGFLMLPAFYFYQLKAKTLRKEIIKKLIEAESANKSVAGSLNL